MTEKPTHVDNLDINPAEDGYIIYQPEQDRVHFVNATAVLILELCTGENSIEEIIRLVQEHYQLEEAPDELVKEAVSKMKAEGLMVEPKAGIQGFSK